MATPFAVSFARVLDLAKAFGEVEWHESVGYYPDFHGEFEGLFLEFFQVGRNATHHYFLAAAEDGRIFRASLDMDAYYRSEADFMDEAFMKTVYITDLGMSPKFDFSGAYIGHH